MPRFYVPIGMHTLTIETNAFLLITATILKMTFFQLKINANIKLDTCIYLGKPHYVL